MNKRNFKEIKMVISTNRTDFENTQEKNDHQMQHRAESVWKLEFRVANTLQIQK